MNFWFGQNAEVRSIRDDAGTSSSKRSITSDPNSSSKLSAQAISRPFSVDIPGAYKSTVYNCKRCESLECSEMPDDEAAQQLKSALKIEACKVNEHCVGLRWEVSDADYLARIIAIIAMGQALHAAQIITDLSPAAPAINDEALSQ